MTSCCLKSASESVHQLYGTSEAWSYLEYIEELAHPTVYLLQYIVSRGDVSGVLGGRPQPPLPPTSVYPSPSTASLPSPLGPLDLLKRHDIVKSFAEVHIEKDATYIAPASMDVEDIYNRLEVPTFYNSDSASRTSSSGTSGHVHYIGMTPRLDTSS